MITRETLWGCADGRNIPIKNLEDTHLLNIIVHIKAHMRNYNQETLQFMIDEADFRKLEVSETFVNYIDPKTKEVMAPTGSWYYPFALPLKKVWL